MKYSNRFFSIGWYSGEIDIHIIPSIQFFITKHDALEEKSLTFSIHWLKFEFYMNREWTFDNHVQNEED